MFFGYTPLFTNILLFHVKRVGKDAGIPDMKNHPLHDLLSVLNNMVLKARL